MMKIRPSSSYISERTAAATRDDDVVTNASAFAPTQSDDNSNDDSISNAAAAAAAEADTSTATTSTHQSVRTTITPYMDDDGGVRSAAVVGPGLLLSSCATTINTTKSVDVDRGDGSAGSVIFDDMYDDACDLGQFAMNPLWYIITTLHGMMIRRTTLARRDQLLSTPSASSSTITTNRGNTSTATDNSSSSSGHHPHSVAMHPPQQPSTFVSMYQRPLYFAFMTASWTGVFSCVYPLIRALNEGTFSSFPSTSSSTSTIGLVHLTFGYILLATCLLSYIFVSSTPSGTVTIHNVKRYSRYYAYDGYMYPHNSNSNISRGCCNDDQERMTTTAMVMQMIMEGGTTTNKDDPNPTTTKSSDVLDEVAGCGARCNGDNGDNNNNIINTSTIGTAAQHQHQHQPSSTTTTTVTTTLHHHQGLLLQQLPARTRYDRYSQKYIPRFDHYCGWLQRPIGEENYRQFLLFVFVHTFQVCYGCVIVTRLLLLVLSLHPRNDGSSVPTSPTPSATTTPTSMMMIMQPILLVVLAVFLAVASVIMVGFSTFHLHLVATNVTTNEHFKRKRLLLLLLAAATDDDDDPLAGISATITTTTNNNNGGGNSSSSNNNSCIHRCVTNVEKEDNNNSTKHYRQKNNFYDLGLVGNIREVLFPRSLYGCPRNNNNERHSCQHRRHNLLPHDQCYEEGIYVDGSNVYNDGCSDNSLPLPSVRQTRKKGN